MLEKNCFNGDLTSMVSHSIIRFSIRVEVHVKAPGVAYPIGDVADRGKKARNFDATSLALYLLSTFSRWLLRALAVINNPS